MRVKSFKSKSAALHSPAADATVAVAGVNAAGPSIVGDTASESTVAGAGMAAGSASPTTAGAPSPLSAERLWSSHNK